MLKKVVDSYMGILPEDVSEIQVKETERAFIAGMIAWRNLTVNIASNKSVEVAETEMVRLEDDLKQLIEKIKEEAHEAIN